MSTLAAIAEAAGAERLEVFGLLHARPDDGLPAAIASVVLLGPAEPGFWAHVTRAPEWQDGRDHPVDRWSARVIGGLAGRFGALPLFPFGGPPHLPFFDWALRSGRAWKSPVTLLVHDRAGLMVSYRGALGLNERLPLPPPAADPCAACADQPCRAACPPGALTTGGYDLAACHTYLDGPGGHLCLTAGCAVRRACPLSQAYGRLPAQSAYHMGLFHR